MVKTEKLHLTIGYQICIKFNYLSQTVHHHNKKADATLVTTFPWITDHDALFINNRFHKDYTYSLRRKNSNKSQFRMCSTHAFDRWCVVRYLVY